MNWFCDLEPLVSRRGILSRRRQLGAPTPEVDLRRGAIVTVAVETGDATETLTSPTEVARECSEWSDRRMSPIHAKWIQRLDVAERHAIWAVGDGRRER